MADDDQSLPTEFDSRFRSVYNPPSPIPGQDTPLYSRANIPKNDTLLERFGGLPTEGPPEAFYTSPVEGKGGTLVEAPKPKKIKEGKYELTPVNMNVVPQSVKEVLFGYDKPVGRYQTWPERLARIVGKGAFDIVGGIPAGVTAPRDAFTGKLQVTNPETGMPTEEAVQRSIEALSVPFKAGTIGVAGVAGPKLGSTAISDAYRNKYLPNGVEKPEAFDRVLPAVRNLETGKISTTKRGNEHADILTRLWEREGGSPNADTMSIYEDMLPRHEMGYYDPLKKQFHPRDSEEWKNIDSPDLNPKQAMRSGMVFSDTQKPAQLLSSLTAAQRKAYNREAFRNGGQLLVPDASAEAVNKLVSEPAYKKWDKAATDAGFTTDAYHGTENFEGSSLKPKRLGGQEFYSTDEPKLAEDYGKNILPLKLNTSNYNVIDAKGKTWDQVNDSAIKAAKAEGKSGVTIHNLRDSAADREVEPATVHITFDPSTVRSRFAKFNPDDIKKNGLLLSDSSKPAQAVSAMANAPRFYSAVENAVNNIKQQRMPADQMLNTLTNSKGVKPEEMDWLGLKEHLQSKGKEPVTKQEIQDFVNANKVELKEVEKGNLTEEEIRNRAKINKEDWDKMSQSQKEVIEAGFEKRPTKYSQYQLPGGEPGSYREKLLTLPLKTSPKAKEAFDLTKRMNEGEFNSLNDVQRRELFNRRDQLLRDARAEEGEHYKSSHWDEPNVLAHVRMNDRTIEGKKSLHLEEIQSDWHQQGREKGYKQNLIGGLTEAEHKEWKRISNEIHEYEKKGMEDGVTEAPEELYDKYKILNDKRIQNENFRPEGVPNAPFKKTWHELALKRMIREAAEKGYDRLSWTPGEAQAERYDLSKQVDAITAERLNNGKYTITAKPKNQDRYQSIGEEISKEKLADHVGKELADKIANQEKKVHNYSGLDLKVGGEGMKGFYDQIIPKALEKISGQKVKTTNIETKKYDPIETSNGMWAVDQKRFATKDEAKQYINQKYGQPIHYIDIPQSLKDQALGKGFPLFSHTGYILTPSSNPNINNENDVPYGAGASNTPSGYPVHIDKRIPQYDEKLKLPSGEPADLHKYLEQHEITEHQLMKRGMSYEQAHKRATERERAAVKRDGLDWSTYEHIMDGYLKQTEHEKPENPPKNLYLKPYPHDKQVLLKKLEK